MHFLPLTRPSLSFSLWARLYGVFNPNPAEATSIILQREEAWDNLYKVTRACYLPFRGWGQYKGNSGTQVPLMRIVRLFMSRAGAEYGTGCCSSPLQWVHSSAKYIKDINASPKHLCVLDLEVWSLVMEQGVEERKYFSFLLQHRAALLL